MTEFICEECGTHYDAQPGRFYCSSRCEQLAHRKMTAPYPGVPMSMPVTIMRARPSGLSPSQLRARDEVLAGRREPRRATRVTDGFAQLADAAAQTKPAPRPRVLKDIRQAVGEVEKRRADLTPYPH